MIDCNLWLNFSYWKFIMLFPLIKSGLLFICRQLLTIRQLIISNNRKWFWMCQWGLSRLPLREEILKNGACGGFRSDVSVFTGKRSYFSHEIIWQLTNQHVALLLFPTTAASTDYYYCTSTSILVLLLSPFLLWEAYLLHAPMQHNTKLVAKTSQQCPFSDGSSHRYTKLNKKQHTKQHKTQKPSRRRRKLCNETTIKLSDKHHHPWSHVRPFFNRCFIPYIILKYRSPWPNTWVTEVPPRHWVTSQSLLSHEFIDMFDTMKMIISIGSAGILSGLLCKILIAWLYIIKGPDCCRSCLWLRRYIIA